jgi:paraquat-inducible protein B
VSEAASSETEFPVADVQESATLTKTLRRNASRLWIVTAISLIVAIVLFVTANRTTGTIITVRFEQGYGIKPGNMLQHRGIEVGEVKAVKLNDNLGGVRVEIMLEPAAEGLAREGSRFWVERPRFSLARVSGLETVVGAKYLGVLPGPEGAPSKLEFEGDETPLTVLDAQVLEVAILFRDGFGLQEGDELRHRGIVVGEVSRVELNDELSGVHVTVRLVESARRLARVGSQFWIERPDVSLTGIRGLDTLVGGRYIAVLPGPPEAEPLARFDGLENAPATTERLEGGLEITLASAHRRGVKAGAPVLYRGHEVGQIVSTGLSPDGSRVESRAYIDPAFKRLVRANSVFWSTSGIQANYTISGGFEVSAETLETIAAGGVSMATPNSPGKPVNTGQRFELYSKGDEEFNEDEWTSWQPHIALGSIELPEGSALPRPVRAALSWKERSLGFTRNRQREGWVLPLSDQRLLGPADLLIPPSSAIGGEAKLQLAGQQLSIAADKLDLHGKLATLELAEPLTDVDVWPTSRLRDPEKIEEVLVVAETIESSFPLPKNRLSSAAGVREWSVDPSFAIDPHLNGACVVSTKDGCVLGIVAVDKGQASVAFVPEP